MTTLTANETYDKGRIYNIRELPRWARVQVHFRREEKWKDPVEWECVAVFKYVDWMYWLWYDEETNEPLIFNWYFTHIDWDAFAMLTSEEIKELWLDK